MKTAILVDGGYYRKVALKAFGLKSPKESAHELYTYCFNHLNEKYAKKNHAKHELYRIFYYDCPPLDSNIYNPITKKQEFFGKSETGKWMNEFLKELTKKRKVALRLGELLSYETKYLLKPQSLNRLINKEITIDDLKYDDVYLSTRQKGVDMKIGVDIATLSLKKQVNQIVLIAGDSDFVPAAKLARREGIDFILDPLGREVKDNLFEHIDGLRSCDKKLYKNKNFEEN